MDLEQKCAIIEEVARDFTVGDLDREFFSDFIIYNDLGLPLAQVIIYNLGSLNSDGQKVVEETWNQLCDLLGVDSEDEYIDLDDMIESGGFDDD
jgi:hypothetical protein